MNPDERRARAKLAANERWSRPGARAEQSAKMVASLRRRRERAVDPDGVMAPDELKEAVQAAGRAWSARMDLAKARRAAPKPTRPPASGPFRPLRDARAASAHTVEASFTLTVKATLEDGVPQSADALLDAIADEVDGLAIVVVPDRDHLVELALYRLSMTAWGHALGRST